MRAISLSGTCTCQDNRTVACIIVGCNLQLIHMVLSTRMGCTNAKEKQYMDSECQFRGCENAKSILPVYQVSTPQVNTSKTTTASTVTKGENEKNTYNSNVDISKKIKVKSIPPILKFDAKVTAKYCFKQSIGKGRYSRVWLVENRLTKQPYAMKIAIGDEGKEIFQNELAVLGRIRHPNIIQLIETFETVEKFYMVLELATGGDLFDRVVSQPHGHFNEFDAARIMKMVLDGVKYLHKLGITHRDLKPDNLLFYHPGHNSKILITDFVIANVRKGGGNNFMQTGCGTPEYIAPEVLMKLPYTSAVDLWALGVVTYIILSGAFPFVNDETSNIPNIKLYRLIMKGSYSFDFKVWEGVSKIAKDFITKLLVVDAQKRMTAAEALEHPWLQNHHSISAVTCASNQSNKESSCSDETISSLSSCVMVPKKESLALRRSNCDIELSLLKQRILTHHRFPTFL